MRGAATRQAGPLILEIITGQRQESVGVRSPAMTHCTIWGHRQGISALRAGRRDSGSSGRVARKRRARSGPDRQTQIRSDCGEPRGQAATRTLLGYRIMDVIVIFMLGLGAGILLHRWQPWARELKPAESATGSPPAENVDAELPAGQEAIAEIPAAPKATPETAAPTDDTDDDKPETSDLAGRLQPLRAAIDTFGRSVAHPRDLRSHREFLQAVELLSDPSVSVATLIDYACGANWAISCAALAALSKRSDGASAATSMLERFKETGGWEVYFALDYVAKLPVRPPVGSVVLRPADQWVNNTMVVSFFVDHFQQHDALGDTADFGGALGGVPPTDLEEAEKLLLQIGHPFAKTLLAELRSWRQATLNRDFLTTIGRFWAAEEDDLLIEHAAIAESILTCEAALTASKARSVLLVGDARTGKTSVARCAAKKLATRGYSVFEASAAELMAGQIYIGELEGRVRRILDELSVNKRVIWFVPSLVQLATSGAHRGQSATILDQILPAL